MMNQCHLPGFTGLIVAFLTLCGPGDEREVYLLGGQSNMQGIGMIAGIGDEVPRRLPGAHFFNGTAFEPLVLGKTRVSAREGEFGPEVGFALEMAGAERPIHLVKDFQSGMPLHHGWDGGKWVGGGPGPGRRNFYPGQDEADENQGVLYRGMLQKYRTALAQLEKQGDTPVARGFVWMQGEQDSKHEESALAYADNLKRLRNRLTEDLGLEAPLPMVFGQVLPDEPAAARFTHREEIREQMARADGEAKGEKAIEQARMVSTDEMELLPDRVHYNARGQLKLGREFAHAMEALHQAVEREGQENKGGTKKEEGSR